MKELPYQAKAVIGRREMVTLPELGLHLCCKADTGARTSALHAEEIETDEDDHGQLWVSFITHSGGPDTPAHRFRLHLHDRRRVTSSNGHSEWRHPMLLGRSAMRRLLVAPGAAFLHGEP